MKHTKRGGLKNEKQQKPRSVSNIPFLQFRGNSKEAERLKENILNGIPVSEKRIKKHTKSLYDVVCKIVGLKEGAI